jgi:lysophospholipase L1-like esterase
VTASGDADLRVLFFGDSIVAGAGDPQGRGWVGRVVEASWAAGLPLTSYGLGVRRQTSVEVAARWLAEARPRLHPGADNRVVFAFGVNDATHEEGAPRVEADVSVATLERVLGEADQLGLPAFVVGPGPVCDPEHRARIRALSERFEVVCRRRGVPYVAVVEALRASSTWLNEAARGDGAHPSAGGYDALSSLVVDGGWPGWLRSLA